MCDIKTISVVRWTNMQIANSEKKKELKWQLANTKKEAENAKTMYCTGSIIFALMSVNINYLEERGTQSRLW